MSYLTPTEYVDRFTAPEAIRLTDTTRSGTPDPIKIQVALNDATLFADAFLASRYALPFDNPPELLRKSVADLAREALHGTKPTEAVTLAADRARALLRDLSAGRATLPLAADGSSPAETPPSLPAASNDGRPRVFTDSALADFTGFGASYGGTVFDGPRSF